MYSLNETFLSLQGEGVRAGTVNVFARLSGCNLQCNNGVEDQAYQPVCDTEFISGRRLDLHDLVAEITQTDTVQCRNVIFTGGEPSLQLDSHLIAALKAEGYHIAIETNGTKALPSGIDWVCVSPKTAEHTLVRRHVDELKYVRPCGMGIPKPQLKADHYIISPAFNEAGLLTRETLQWCVKLCLENPRWRLSVQQHKAWMVR